MKSTGCVPPTIPLIRLSGSSVLQPGQTVTLTSTPAMSYLWSTGETTQSIQVSSAGIYSVQAFDGINCFSTSADEAITEATTSIDNPESTSNYASLYVYPNPARDQVFISFVSISKQEAELFLTDIAGRTIIHKSIRTEFGDNKIELALSEIPHGIYFANLISINEKKTVKLIVQ